jgi:hypothetical protein
MKLNIWLILLALALPSFNAVAQGLNEDILTFDLQKSIEENPNGTHSVYVVFEDRVDVRTLENELISRKASMDERAYEIITKLQAKASEVQPAFLDFLNRLDGIDKEAIHDFWIANVVFFEGTTEAIAKVSNYPGLEQIDLNWPIHFYDLEQGNKETMAPTLVNNVETGLEAIGAPEMWAMGYTGYGRKVLIVDTGEDPYHPALYNNFSYHNRPLDESWASPNGPHICEDDHGTHVTGTAVGIDRILRDTIGVAYEGEWMGGPIPLSGCNYSETVLDAFATFQWALNPDGNASTTDDMPDAINNSWGRPNPTSFDCELPGVVNMYDALMGAGIAVIYAAGNEGPGVSTIGHPAINNYDLVRFFAVGNVNANNPNFPIANGSSRGPSVCFQSDESLYIKPEVSAPGTNVRSSVFGDGYNTYTGTSMAAPHVAGAILILKEAFPYLSGEDLMLALYFSAVDLGEPGEDNDYGMGMINLPNAFNYLIEEGHEPIPPVDGTLDVTLLNSEVNTFSCLEGVAAYIEVENGGTATVESIEVTLTFTGSQTVTETHTWEVFLSPGDRAEVLLPPVEVPPGAYELVVDLTSVNGEPDPRSLNNRLKQEVTILDINELPAEVAGGTTPCANSTIAVQSNYEGDAEIRWYDDFNGDNLIGEGQSILVELDDEPQTVYVQVSPVEKVGKPDISTGTVQYDDDNNGLRFDTDVPIRIRRVKVYAEEPGGSIIRLRRADGSGSQTVVTLAEGENIVELDFNVPAGEDHELFMQTGKPLAFTVAGTEYPYTIDNVVTITKPISGSNIFYYYFFDWEIEYDYFCGRTAVEIDPQASGGGPDVSIAASDVEVNIYNEDPEIDFTGTADAVASWYWNFGDGNTSNMQNPSHTYADTGSYVVTLTVVDNNGCSSSALIDVRVFEEVVSSINNVTLENRLMVYPNPAKDELFIQFSWAGTTDIQYYMVDLLGRPVTSMFNVASGTSQESLSLAGFPAGTYMLIAESSEGRVTKRIVKQ